MPTYILLILGLFFAYNLHQLYETISYKIVNFRLRKGSNISNLRVNFNMEIVNEKNFSLDIEKISGVVLMQNIQLGNFSTVQKFTIPAKNKIVVQFEFYTDNLKIIENINTLVTMKNYVLTISGQIKTYKINIPFKEEYSLNLSSITA